MAPALLSLLSAAGGDHCMNCPRCRAANPDDARFCEDCSAGLELTCLEQAASALEAAG